MAEAGKLDVALLYLYTVHSEKFYAALGWTLHGAHQLSRTKVAIMTYAPTRSKP